MRWPWVLCRLRWHRWGPWEPYPFVVPESMRLLAARRSCCCCPTYEIKVSLS